MVQNEPKIGSKINPKINPKINQKIDVKNDAVLTFFGNGEIAYTTYNSTRLPTVSIPEHNLMNKSQTIWETTD